MSIELKKVSTFVFTNYAYQSLAQRGFTTQPPEMSEESGMHSQKLTFQNGICLEWLTIDEEELFKRSPHSKVAQSGLTPFITASSNNKDSLPTKIGKIPVLYEGSNENSSAPSNKTEHSNTCNRLVGVYIRVKDEEAMLSIDGLYYANPSDSLYDYFSIHKEFGFWGVVVACKDFETFKSTAKPDFLFRFNNKQAALIKQNPNSWDIIVIPAQ